MDLELKLISIAIGGVIGLILVVLLCIENHYNTKDTITSLGFSVERIEEK